MPRNKIVMGVSPYGRTYLLNDVGINGIGAPARPGAPSESNLEGVTSYSHIIYFTNYATYTWSDVQKVPYAVHENLWISFDNEESVKEKMKYVVENEFAGAFLYELSLDNFQSDSDAGFQPFEFANLMKRYLQTAFPVKPTSPPTPTPQTGYRTPCEYRKPELYNPPFKVDPRSCGGYYYCSVGANNQTVSHHLSCGPGMWWSGDEERCVYAYDVFCGNIIPVMPPPPGWNGTWPFIDEVNNATKPKLQKLDN
uniref:Chitin-binding type-2 domain-containing protein n=1 Tax=Panagrellus redivivus TaxID=6233 RepID=A0A7E4VU01_PANRE